MWKPITAASEIPAIGTRERYNVDFKAKLVADSFEIAKDVAAFSNTFGGTLIIGGAGGDRVEKYLPVDSAAAHDVGRLVDEAVRDRCRPAPFIDIFELPHEGGLLVAVNVWPSHALLVGVRVLVDEITIGKKPHKPQDVFCFPYRVGTNTRNLTPEQMPMFMDANTRRVTAALQQQIGQIAMLMSSRRKNEKTAPKREAVTIVAVDLLENALVVDLHPPKKSKARVTVPLDAVATVCPTKAGCYVYLRGFIELPVVWFEDAPKRIKRFKHPYFDPTA